MHRQNLDLGVVGNCGFAGLIDAHGRLVWACLPRFDSDPVFSHLVDDDPSREPRGLCEIALPQVAHTEQGYDGNSAVLVTRLYGTAGEGIEIRDFAPRFTRHNRTFRPSMLIRTVTPLYGWPRVRIRVRPTCGYGAAQPDVTRGSNHIRYVMPDWTLRLTTDAPVSYVIDEALFALERPIHMILGPDESLQASVAGTARDFYELTHDYWREWSRTLSIPFEWQDAVIRAAITLKLLSYEETGAVIAALTTSIPEAPGTARNWDYRYCWPRDAYFVIHALNRLGATRTMEAYLSYLLNIVTQHGGELQPVYGIGLETGLTERIAGDLAGYRGHGPVRVGNQAYEHIQNDVYGSVILATTQAFFDRRLLRRGDADLFARLEPVGEHATRVWMQPDAGLWELRGRAHIHTFSAVMCWAACDHLARIATHLGIRDRATVWRAHAAKIRDGVLEHGYSDSRQSFTYAFGGGDVDASLLLLHHLGFIAPDDPRFIGTVAAIEKDLRAGRYLYRYATPDDFGAPETAFTICTFWYVDALAALGRRDEARELFEHMLSRRNPLGILSEDIDPKTGELWGNFPQTYSMVGLINSAMRLSRSWEEAF